MDAMPKSSGTRAACLVAVAGTLVGCGAPDERLGTTHQEARSLLFEKAKEPLLPKDLREGDRFGSSIAVSSRWAAVGAPGDDFDDSDAFDETGGAVVFARTQGNVWKEVASLRPPQRFPDAQFGRAIATTDALIAIGAQEADPAGDGTKWGAGLVATFRYQNSSWEFESLLHDPYEAEDRFFGSSLSMDEQTLLVGAYGGDQVFAYSRTKQGWSDPITINSPSPNPGGTFFGFSVALREPYVFVGAIHDNGDGSSDQEDRGAVYVFKRHENGFAPDGELERNTFARKDLFGWALAVRNDLAVGTVNGDTSATTFRLDSSGRWGSPSRIVPRDAANSSAFGRSVAIGVRDSVWVGAAREENFDGVAFPFLLEEDGWVEAPRVTFSEEGRFGYSMASASGALMVGAPLAGTENQGAVYVIETSDGSICTQNDDCFSTHCVDGVCCNTSCEQPCHSCLASEKDAGGVEGTCEPKRAAVPDSACADEGAASCGTTGLCDGAGNCAKYRAGIRCGDPFCSDNQLIGSALCNGSGDCELPPASGCKNYVCSDGACQDACSNSSDCDARSYCSDGRCRPKHGMGEACGSADECLMGHCADEVCCDQSCTGQCEACGEPGSEGSCLPLRAGTPPRVEASVTSGPAELCARLFCDGVERSSASLPASSSVSCSPAGCSNGVELAGGRCDGNGSCAIPPSKPCGAYACSAEEDGGPAARCLTTCSTIDDCAPDFYCTTDRECRPIEALGAVSRGCGLATPRRTGRDGSCLLGVVGLAVLSLRRSRMTPRKETPAQ